PRLLFTYTVASFRNSRVPLFRSCCWRNFAKASSASVPACHSALSLYPLVEWHMTTASYAATTLRTSARTEAGASGLDSAVRTVFSHASASLYIVRASGAAYTAEAASSVLEKQKHAPSRPAAPAKKSRNPQITARVARLPGARSPLLRRAPGVAQGTIRMTMSPPPAPRCCRPPPDERTPLSQLRIDFVEVALVNEDLARFSAGRRRHQAFHFHHVHQSRRAAEADAQAALQIRDRRLPALDDEARRLVVQIVLLHLVRIGGRLVFLAN